MEIVKLYSPLEDLNIKKDLDNSPIWKNVIHADDLNEELTPGKVLFEYSIKFEGLKPIQVTDIKKITK